MNLLHSIVDWLGLIAWFTCISVVICFIFIKIIETLRIDRIIDRILKPFLSYDMEVYFISIITFFPLLALTFLKSYIISAIVTIIVGLLRLTENIELIFSPLAWIITISILFLERELWLPSAIRARDQAEREAEAARIKAERKAEEARIKAEQEAEAARKAKEARIKAEQEAEAARKAKEARIKAEQEAEAARKAEEARIKAEQEAEAARKAEEARIKAEQEAEEERVWRKNLNRKAEEIRVLGMVQNEVAQHRLIMEHETRLNTLLETVEVQKKIQNNLYLSQLELKARRAIANKNDTEAKSALDELTYKLGEN